MSFMSVISDCEKCLPKCTRKGKKYVFIPVLAMKACGEMRCHFIHSLTLALDGREW
jgi:hypothetical protein